MRRLRRRADRSPPRGCKRGRVPDTMFVGIYANRVVTATRIEVTHVARARTRNWHGHHRHRARMGRSLDLHGTWRDFRWPLVGENVAMRSASGEYSISGVWPYDVRTVGPLEAAGPADPMQVEMEGKLATERLTVSSATVEAFDGQASVSGEVGWAPQERWSVMGDAADINPAAFARTCRASSTFDFAREGPRIRQRQATSQFDIRGLAGRLRGSPRAAAGASHARRTRGSWIASAPRARRHHAVRGWAHRGGARPALRPRRGRPQPHQGRTAAASCAAQGTVRGTWRIPSSTPNCMAAASSTKASRSRASMRRWTSMPAGAAHRTSTSVPATSCIGERTLSELAFALNGSAADHVARVEREGNRPCARFGNGRRVCAWRMARAAAQVASERQRVAAAGRSPRRWTWRSPAITRASTGSASTASPRSFCADADWTPDEVDRDGECQRAADANAHVGPHAIRGLSRQAHRDCSRVRRRSDAPVAGQPCARISSTPPSRTSSRAAARSASRFGTGLVTVNATRVDGGCVRSRSMRARSARSRRDSKRERSTQRWQDMPVTGELHVQTAELGLITLYVPEIDRVSGKLVDGSLGHRHAGHAADRWRS